MNFKIPNTGGSFNGEGGGFELRIEAGVWVRKTVPLLTKEGLGWFSAKGMNHFILI